MPDGIVSVLFGPPIKIAASLLIKEIPLFPGRNRMILMTDKRK
jgi:hypothetical protein